METVVLVIHLIFALAIIGLVLIQRSEGGGLGIGGGGLGNLAGPRGTASALTRATGFCAAAFFVTSLILGVLAGRDSSVNHKILDALQAPAAPSEAPLEMPQTGEADQSPAAAPVQAPLENKTETPEAPVSR